MPEARALYLDAEFENTKDENERDENEEFVEHNQTAPESAPVFNKNEEIHGLVVKSTGNTLKLKCPAAGNPRPNITWFKNNEEVPRSLRVIRNRWNLRVEDIALQDAGNYTCRVCNYLRCISHTVKVDVIGELQNFTNFYQEHRCLRW